MTLTLAGCSQAIKAAPANESSGMTASPVAPASVATSPAASPSHAPTRTATAATASTKPLAGKVIVIDPGHNGGNFTHTAEIDKLVNAGFGQRKACNTTGTETNSGYTEAAYTFDVATRLAAVLRAEGAHVVMTRTSNSGVGPCINERAAIGNAAHADAVLSIHGDGNLAKGARGFQVIVSTHMVGGAAILRDSQRLANDVRDDFRAGTGMPYSNYNGGGTGETHRPDIGGLNLSDRPAVLIETGNMRSSVDAALMRSATWREREAHALAAGLVLFLR